MTAKAAWLTFGSFFWKFTVNFSKNASRPQYPYLPTSSLLATDSSDRLILTSTKPTHVYCKSEAKKKSYSTLPDMTMFSIAIA